jgi:hypothetical protein
LQAYWEVADIRSNPLDEDENWRATGAQLARIKSF